jgi:hypothetical protein
MKPERIIAAATLLACVDVDGKMSNELIQLAKLFTLRPREEYHEDLGTVIWWRLPINDPPVVDREPDDWDNGYGEGPTHFSPLPDPRFMTAADGAKIHD